MLPNEEFSDVLSKLGFKALPPKFIDFNISRWKLFLNKEYIVDLFRYYWFNFVFLKQMSSKYYKQQPP